MQSKIDRAYFYIVYLIEVEKNVIHTFELN